MLKLLPIFITVVGLLFSACTPDAPRSNPLDPFHQAAVESGGQLKGQVMQKTAPFPPLPFCDVFILPEKKFTSTDEDGRFLFTALQAGGHQLIAAKSGYDSIRVDIPADSVVNGGIFIYMNTRPLFENLRIHSEYIDQWWPEPVLSVIAEATVHDADGEGDIESLWLNIADYDSGFVFATTFRPDSFVLRLEEQDFPGNDLADIVGKSLRATVLDRDSSRSVITDAKLVRIISPSPEAIAPTGLAVADPSPLFEWQPFIAAYRFSYFVSVYFIRAGVPTLMFTSDPLPVQQLNYQYPDSLSSGTYFWTVSALDAFGNIGRSKEASFTVP